MDQTAYIAFLERKLRAERRRSAAQQAANLVLAAASVALLCMLALATNLV